MIPKEELPPDPVTVDLDNPNGTDILVTWTTLERAGGDVYGRVSSGGNGVHIVAGGIDSQHPHYHYRRMAGDDPMRIAKDLEKPWRPKGVLFDSKGEEKAGEWFGDPHRLVDKYLYSIGGVE